MPKSRDRWVLAIVGPLLLGSITLAAPLAAHASTEPPWYPGADSAGSLTFYNSSGQVITGGSITDAPIAAYVEASTNDHRSGDTKATLYAYTPKLGELPATWSGNLLSRSTNYPNASAPAPLNTATEPVVTGFATDTTLASYISQFPNTDVSNDGYAGLYELRVQVSGPGIGLEQGVYWNTVISVDVTSGTISDPTAGTWSVDWPPPSGPAIQAALHGTSKVGSVDSCVPTGTTGATKVVYAWQKNGKAISGAPAANYKIPPALLGGKLTCSITATFDSGTSVGVSKAVTVGLGAALVPTTKPVVKGAHKPGKAEKVTAGKWSPAATKVIYQWYVGRRKVHGATKSSFTVPKSDKGKRIHCAVTASATGYAKGIYATPAVKIT